MSSSHISYQEQVPSLGLAREDTIKERWQHTSTQISGKSGISGERIKPRMTTSRKSVFSKSRDFKTHSKVVHHSNKIEKQVLMAYLSPRKGRTESHIWSSWGGTPAPASSRQPSTWDPSSPPPPHLFVHDVQHENFTRNEMSGYAQKQITISENTTAKFLTFVAYVKVDEITHTEQDATTVK